VEGDDLRLCKLDFVIINFLHLAPERVGHGPCASVGLKMGVSAQLSSSPVSGTGVLPGANRFDFWSRDSAVRGRYQDKAF
jgi:hypothetical protein